MTENCHTYLLIYKNLIVMKFKFSGLFVFILCGLLQGCGGGRLDFGDQAPSSYAVSTNSFTPSSGFEGLEINGFARSMQITGTCTGTMQLAQAPKTSYYIGNSTTVGGEIDTLIGIRYGQCTDENLQPTYAVLNSAERSYSIDRTNTRYENSEVIGTWISWHGYPASSNVGDSGTLGEMQLTDRSTSEDRGWQVWTYTVEAETTATAIFDLIKTTYSPTDSARAHPTKTEHQRYRLLPQGLPQLLSIDWEDDRGFVFHAK